jgi:hypothetical protein
MNLQRAELGAINYLAAAPWPASLCVECSADIGDGLGETNRKITKFSCGNPVWVDSDASLIPGQARSEDPLTFKVIHYPLDGNERSTGQPGQLARVGLA